MVTRENKLKFENILNEELQLATGCTEPIAVAYCSAQMRKVLGAMPEKILAEVSGNILKNVKSVIVPNSGNLKGVDAAVSVGVVAGNADAGLQVVANVTEEQAPAIRKYCEETPIEVRCMDTLRQLDIRITGWAGENTATVQIANNHENIIYVSKNGEVLLEKPASTNPEDSLTDKTFMTLKMIYEYCDGEDLTPVIPLLKRQVECNSVVAEKGITENWGANIGKIILSEYGSDIRNEAKAYAAAGSDARMSGCEEPVVIVSGSGNQGITASMPVYRYAKYLKVSEEKLYRALALSDLVTIYQKVGIGRLSAYCGAISAGVGAGAGIAYLCGGDYKVIAHTVVNAVAMLSGTICDGAKPSCAAKIAEAVDAGILGYLMYKHGKQFYGEDGIVKKGVDRTIHNVGVLASVGMTETDHVILKIMTEENN